jgi:LacI family transcriptional regulator
MESRNAPTMKDVAREAGVALGTVSKVINGLPVGEDYRLKVEDAIQKLNYQVNTYARGLKISKSQTITLIIPTLLNPFFAGFAYEVEKQVYARNRKLILCCSDGNPEKELDYLSLAAQNKTEGIIAITYSDISNQVPEHIPLIAFDREFENHAIPRIASDNFEGGILATQKLLEFGCNNPAFIGFHSPISGEADKRFEGYLNVCKKNNIIPQYLFALEHEASNTSINDFIKEHEDSKAHRLNFDGIFANTDYHALLTIQVLKELGYLVPADVQVIGFDGIKKFYPENEYMVSTIRQPLPDFARYCLHMLLDEDIHSLPTLTLLPVTYEYGGTTLK